MYYMNYVHTHEERMSSRVSNLFFSALTWQVRLQAAVEAEAAAKRAVLRTGAFTATAVTTPVEQGNVNFIHT